MPIQGHEIDKLFTLAATDPRQSFGINNWCYARAMRMVGLMLQEGVAPGDIGWVSIWAPPKWLYEGEAWPVMSAPPTDGFSLRDLLGGGSQARSGPYVFEARDENVVIWRPDGAVFASKLLMGDSPLSYHFRDINLNVLWDSHIAPVVKAAREEPFEFIVIDPDQAPTPLSVAEWRRQQDPAGRACALLADWSGKLSVSREHSSHETLQAVIEADPDLAGLNADERRLIAMLTDGQIDDGVLINPYDPPIILNDDGRPSIAATFEHFGDWLAPLAAFKAWRTRRLKEIAIAACRRAAESIRR